MRDLYQELYKRLNTAQKRAVDAVEGPVMVIAGPGTGKTQILTLRIANILRKTDTDPKSILALTFTESGAVSMRKRLADIMGDAAYLVRISTFHGFCNDIIRQYPEAFPRIIGSRSITEVEQIRLLEELITKADVRLLRPFGDTLYYVRPVLSNINTLKREGVDEEEFRNAVLRKAEAFAAAEDKFHARGAHAGKMKGEYKELEKQIAKNSELADLYAQYQKRLAEERLYDYSDMIMEVLRALRADGDLLLILQEKYQYVLVDEHQDTNNAQNKILELLMSFHPNPNIFIVGDEKQAIFRFQGASLENFSYFKKLYPSAEAITLAENYRSTQEILDSAHGVAGAMRLAGSELHAQNGAGEKIRVAPFVKEDAELAWVASSVADTIRGGASPEEVAILYRDNRDAFPAARALERHGVPFVIESEQDIFGDFEIRKLMALLEAALKIGSPEHFLRAMHVDFLGIPPLDTYMIAQASSGRNGTPLMSIVSNNETMERLHVSEKEKIKNLFAKVSSWARKDANMPLTETFESVLRESGYLEHILALPDPLAAIERTNAVFDEVKALLETNRHATLADFFSYLTTLREHNLNVKRNISHSRERRVRLMTAHKSKGQEFGHVYIIGACDGHWGNRKKSDVLPLFPEVYSLFGSSDWAYSEMDDERRLFYVALTRARKTATISFSREGENGRERLPSAFLEEVKSECVERIDTGAFEKALFENPKRMFAEAKAAHAPDAERKFVGELFRNRGFSVTHLNNYLECPWKYFYVNLLRIPQAETKHQLYGIAVHEALRAFFSQLKSGTAVSKQLLAGAFASHLEKLPLGDADFKEALEKGKQALLGYYGAYAGSWNANVLVELAVAGVSLGGATLTGKIDKLEFESDGGVSVVDYKTGKPKSRGVIEGATKSSDGNIKRQLVFYKLLLDAFEGGKYRMKRGIIDFVEPDDKGRYHREEFEIGNNEISELKELIKKTADEIISLEFWGRTCGEKDCEFCRLRGLAQGGR